MNRQYRNDNDNQWTESYIHSSQSALKAISGNHSESNTYFRKLVRSFPVLDAEAEKRLGKTMDDAREQMMIAAFSTKAGINIILEQVSAFCSGDLKLKDILGHRQLEDDEREELSDSLKAGFEKLTSIIANDQAFDAKKQAMVVSAMRELDLGMDFVLMVVRRLQAIWAELSNARNAWYEKCGTLCCTENDLLKSLKDFSETGKSQYICTKDQFNRYQKTYNDWMSMCDRLSDQVGDIAAFESTMQMINLADERYTRAREIMIDCNLKLVYTLVRKYNRRNMPADDLIQEGTIGLMRAVEKYDYRLGNKFSTYATWWIKQSLTRAYADQSRTVRVPIHLVDTINRINKMARVLEDSLNRAPSSEEIANALNLTEEFVSQMQQVGMSSISMDAPVGEDDDATYGDFIEDEHSPSQIDILSESDMAQELDRILGTLSEREEKIVRMRYGIGEERNYTLEEVGRFFNLTRERIRQIEVRAVEKLGIPFGNSELPLFI